MSILTGGDLLGNIVGLISGHIYYYLKDIVPVTFGKDLLITPNFMKRYLDNSNNALYRPVATITSSEDRSNASNTDNSGGFRNRWDNSSGGNRNANSGSGNNNNSGDGGAGGFQAFSGRGHTWG